ncbi:DNAse I-like superfamily protein [Actinidia rufa]|uniref:DNAse I-like superfamily protein n=1 Tax=Actinidia rufa TaxID=165716 RepID=A0A7J0FB12_9ERIC|nr:DNAse I-like superfamily protein [Actinidia rufa]
MALSRLVKDNVALIVVLEAKFSNQGIDNPGKRQLVCVANTHVNVHQDLKDVKLWQVHTLLKGLEKIAVSTYIPMLVCGDFNAIPGSAPHALLVMGKVDPMHPELAVDPLGILRPVSKLTHRLPLVSAYSPFARMGVGLGLEQHRRRMDPTTNEPLFTNCTRDFIGTHDYIFYTADSLTVESLLELLDEDSLRKDTALPSPEWSSDHIALLAEFRCMPRTGR